MESSDSNNNSSVPTPATTSQVSRPLFQRSPADRLSLPFGTRFGIAVSASTASGAILGVSHGCQASALRFRAENTHRLPTTQKGWYLYHKTKNYNVALSGIREARRMGIKLGFWTAMFFALEDVVDSGRATMAEDWGNQEPGKDALSTICASLTTAGAFSLWNRLPLNTAASMAKWGLGVGVAYGATQDLLNLFQGRRVGYLDWMRGSRGRDDDKDSV